MSAALQDDHFDDHLALGEISFGKARAIVFHGASGSGKSTCINHLLRRHPDLAGRPVSRISGGPIDWRTVAPPEHRIVVIDELLELKDLMAALRLLAAGHIVIAASHLPSWLTSCIGLFWRLHQFATDRAPQKIERHLARRGVSYTPQTVAAYCDRFGATYTDAEIILEHTGGEDFDIAYRQFMRRCDLKLDQATPSLVFRSVLDVVYWNTRRSSG